MNIFSIKILTIYILYFFVKLLIRDISLSPLKSKNLVSFVTHIINFAIFGKKRIKEHLLLFLHLYKFLTINMRLSQKIYMTSNSFFYFIEDSSESNL